MQKSFVPDRISFVPLWIGLLALVLQACGPTVYYVRPPQWQDAFTRDSVIASYRDVLKDVTVFIDPGHGGEDRAGVGPAGDVVEADVNLRVGLLLRDYLKKAGANVLLSRETDTTVPLEARAQQANASEADVFVSIHHNAAGDRHTNYTTTFYHARQGLPGYAPSSQDLARFIQRDLSYAMGNPGPLASFDGTMSDDLIHPGVGFSVLRNTTMTAVLVECAFFTSAYEEQRLRLPEFNAIQAWGIFRGIGKYFQAGIPRLTYDAPLVFGEASPKIDILVSGGGDILDESIVVYIDGEEQGFTYNRKTGRIAVAVGRELSQGYHHLTAQVRNSNGNSSAPFERYFAVGNPPVLLRTTTDPAILPPDRSAFSIVSVLAIDSTGSSVPDGLPIRFRSSSGLDTMLVVREGRARVHVFPDRSDRVTFDASNGPVRTEGLITISAEATYTRGLVMGTDGNAITRAELRLPGGMVTTTSERGEFIIAGKDTDGMKVTISAPGYFGRTETLTAQPVQDPVLLTPVARGVLFEKILVLDIPGEDAAPDDRIDMLALRHLQQLLTASGATVVVTEGEGALTLKDALALYTGAPVIQFSSDATDRQITLLANALNASREFGVRMQRVFPQFTGVPLNRFVLRVPWKHELKHSMQIGVRLPVPSARTYAQQAAPLFASNIAWAVYTAILAAEGHDTAGNKLIEVTVQDASGNAAPYVTVQLNHSLTCVTDNVGICRFVGMNIDEDEVRILNSDNHVVKGVRTEVLR